MIDLDGIISAFVFIFQLEGKESQMDVFPRWGLNNPIAIFFVFVVMVTVFGVRVKVFDTIRCLQMASTNCFEKAIIVEWRAR